MGGWSAFLWASTARRWRSEGRRGATGPPGCRTARAGASLCPTWRSGGLVRPGVQYQREPVLNRPGAAQLNLLHRALRAERPAHILYGLGPGDLDRPRLATARGMIEARRSVGAEVRETERGLRGSLQSRYKLPVAAPSPRVGLPWLATLNKYLALALGALTGLVSLVAMARLVSGAFDGCSVGFAGRSRCWRWRPWRTRRRGRLVMAARRPGAHGRGPGAGRCWSVPGPGSSCLGPVVALAAARPCSPRPGPGPARVAARAAATGPSGSRSHLSDQRRPESAAAKLQDVLEEVEASNVRARLRQIGGPAMAGHGLYLRDPRPGPVLCADSYNVS